MSLSSVLKSLQKGWLKDVLTGAGLTLGSAAVSLSAFNVGVSALKANMGGVSSTILGLAHLMGIDVAMSLVLGAVVSRHTLQAGKLTLMKK